MIGPFVDIQGVLGIKLFFNFYGCSNLRFYNTNKLVSDFKYNFLLGSSLAEVENVSVIFCIGLNLRLEAPLLNSRIRKNNSLNSDITVISFGVVNFGQTLNYSNSLLGFVRYSGGKVRKFINLYGSYTYSVGFLNENVNLKDTSKFLVGLSVLRRLDVKDFYYTILSYVHTRFDTSSLGVISNSLGFISSNIVPVIGRYSENNTAGIYCLGVDELGNHYRDTKGSIIVYHGFLRTEGELFFKSSFLIPMKGPYESNMIYMNLEGRYRLMRVCTVKNNLNYSDWEIFNVFKILTKKLDIRRDVSYLGGANLVLEKFFDSLINYNCYYFYDIVDMTNVLRRTVGSVPLEKSFDIKEEYLGINNSLYKSCKIMNTNLFRLVNNYYSENYYLRNSKIMGLGALKIKEVLNW